MQIKNLSNFYTLILLGEGSKHGYEIQKHIEQKTGKNLSFGQLYPFLQKLEDNNLIVVETTGERDKKTYKLTNEGNEFLKNQISKFSELLELALDKTVKSCYTCNCKIVSNYHEEGGKIFCCKMCAKHH